ncbi:MAG: hypothetical protein ABFD12_02830, partial [Syntrophorhabdus sp.]
MNVRKICLITIMFMVTIGILSVSGLIAGTGMESIVDDPSKMMVFVNNRKVINTRFGTGETLLHF